MTKKKKVVGKRRESAEGALLEKRLAAAGKQWKKDKGRKLEGFAEIPDGTYLAKLTRMEVKIGNSDNLGMLSIWTIVQGELKGETATRWDNLEREDLRWVQDYLRKFELVDVDSLDITDLKEACETILAEHPAGRIVLKTKGEYQNLDLLKTLNLDEEEDEDGEEPEAEEEEEEETEEDADEDDEASEEEEEEEASDDTYGLAEGDTVSFMWKMKKDKKMKRQTGKLAEMDTDSGMGTIDVDDEQVEVQLSALTKVEDEEEAEEPEEEETAPDKGDEVKIKVDGKKLKGVVNAVNEKKKTAVVKVGKTLHTVKWSELAAA